MCKYLPLIIEGCLILAYLGMNGIFGYYYTYSYDLENNKIIQEIEENLRAKLIYTFRNSTVCSSNEEELIIDKFDAIPEFCSCFGTFMSYGKCGANNAQCQTINSINSKDYLFINSQYICVRKSDKAYIDYLNNNDIISKDKECPTNYKSCGIIDTLERKLCVKNGNNCPIKKADIENKNSTSNQILSLFRLRPSYPCMNPNEKNWVYHGDYSTFTKRCTRDDIRYEKIDQFNTNLYDLYKDNNILSSFPTYDVNELKKEKIYFYARNILGINKEKASQFSKEKLLSSQKHINNCNTAMKIVTLIVFLPLVCLGGAAGAGSGNGGGNVGIAILSIFGIYAIPGSIIYFILSIIIFVNNNRIATMLDIGSDDFMNEIINNLLADGSINFRIPLASIIMFPLIIIGGVICLFTSNNLF